MNIPSTSKRRRILNPTKRAAILKGARAVFMREGFSHGSMDAVAAQAGVGKQTIYRHFRSKEALVVALVEAMTAPEVLQALPRSVRNSEQLRSLLLTFVAGVASSDSLRFYRAIVAESERAPGLGRLFWEAGPRQIRAAITQLIVEEYGAASSIIAEQLIHLSLGDAYQHLVLGTGTPGLEVFERQIDAALELFGRAAKL